MVESYSAILRQYVGLLSHLCKARDAAIWTNARQAALWDQELLEKLISAETFSHKHMLEGGIAGKLGRAAANVVSLIQTEVRAASVLDCATGCFVFSDLCRHVLRLFALENLLEPEARKDLHLQLLQQLVASGGWHTN